MKKKTAYTVQSFYNKTNLIPQQVKIFLLELAGSQPFFQKPDTKNCLEPAEYNVHIYIISIRRNRFIVITTWFLNFAHRLVLRIKHKILKTRCFPPQPEM